MLRNYFTLAIRNLLKGKIYSFISIFGLAIGIAVCLVILRYVEFELSYDRFHRTGENVYRILTTLYSDEKKIAAVGYDLGPALANEIPEIKTYVRINRSSSVITYAPPQSSPVQFREDNVLWVDSTFLDVFTFEPKLGNLSTALDKPSTAVITESVANKYFGEGADPVGKLITLSNEGDFEITAVVKDIPQNSHLSFDFLLSLHNVINSPFYKNNPRWNNFITYIKLNPHSTIGAVENKIQNFITRYAKGEATSNHSPVIAFQPITEIHLSGGGISLDDGDNDTARAQNIYFFTLISIFILSIAWVNYINLSTAGAIERAREVGVKKAIGAGKNQLIAQFMLESTLVNLLGVVLAAGLACLLLPILGDIVGKNISFDFTKLSLWYTLIAFLAAGSVISGTYPAFVLSSYNAVDVIKGLPTQPVVRFSLRQALVTFQFIASLLLIAGTFTIYRQIHFMQNQDKGLNMDEMLIVNGPHIVEGNGFDERLISFKNELYKLPFVSKVATSETVPGGGHSWETHSYRKGASKQEIIPGENINVVFVDPDFIETYGIRLQAGKPWNRDIATDMKSVMINEAALIPFGLGDAQKALHEKLVFEGDNIMPIVGVVENFNWKLLKTGYLPTVLWPEKIALGRFSIQVHGSPHQAVAGVEKLYKITFPGSLFEYSFLNDSFNKQYVDELQFEKIFSLFAIFATLIAGLGLWGLASFTTLQRLKEINVRKVLGASTSNIVFLLLVQFVKLLIIAGFIGLPIIWYLANSWLTNYAFRIPFSWDLFIVPFAILGLITFGTISIQILRAAKTNPAVVLRSQ